MKNVTKIYLIDPRTETLIHGISIDYESSVKKIQEFIINKEAECGELERVIVSMGTVRIMNRSDPIPIPLRPAVRK